MNGVHSFCREAARTQRGRDRRACARCSADLLRALPEERVRGAEQRADADHRRRDRRERRRGEGRERLLAVRREAELLERHRRQVQHASCRRAPSRRRCDRRTGRAASAMRLCASRQHLVASAVAQRVGRARLDARRHLDAADERLVSCVGQRLAVERDRRAADRSGRRSACTCGSSARSEFQSDGRHVPGTRQHGSSGSRCTRPRRTTPDRRPAGPAPSSGRPTTHAGSRQCRHRRITNAVRCRPAPARSQISWNAISV